MAPRPPLPRSFYERPALLVARELLGKKLVRIEEGRAIVGAIIETEAYCGAEDLGCHARSGKTKRNTVMYGPPGHAYVYFTYGMHWMLNFVTMPQGEPHAVLLRAIQPLEGLEIIAARRDGRPPQAWTDGPAKVCQALNIDRRLNGHDLCAPQAQLYVCEGAQVADEDVTITSRVGLNAVPEPWKSMPWRFVVNRR